MHNISAKLLFLSLLAAAAGALQACSADAPDISPAEKKQEMKFAPAEVSRATTSSVNYVGSKFAIFADMKHSAGNHVKVFHNVEVEYDGAAWFYDGKQYWIPEYEHSFVAIHPSHALLNADGLQYSASRLSFAYSIPTTDGTNIDLSRNHDLLAATHRRMYTEGAAAAVTLKFGHLMSLVNIAPAFSDNLMTADDYILIRKLEFSGVCTKADIEITPAQRLSNTQTDDIEFSITGHTAGKPEIVFSEPFKVMNKAAGASIFADSDAVIMFPQAFREDSEAKIIFHFTVNDDSSVRTLSMPLNGRTWESGKSYLYRATIERTGLNIESCEITPWNDIRGDITVD
ncbi:MAG: fimbrillin family protein [Muribaculaceae bacterium]|nr:fimbrillin family protein [Muribaculaceae bacterium]